MSDLWAVTCFFNPANYRRRIQNYHWFRERLNVPLVTVELSFNGEFALTPGDAEILVQLDQGDILFQKERLLNIALRQVPNECRAIAWVDCDVIFGSDDWPLRTLAALKQFALVQPFSHRYDLKPESVPDDIAGWPNPHDRLSLMAKIAEAGLTAADFCVPAPPIGKPAWGLAWAARKEILDKHGLYDGCVLAGGDLAIWCAAMGVMEGPFFGRRLNDAMFRHYMEWAGPFFEAVQRSVGLVNGDLFHLWHGSLQDRRYGSVLSELQTLAFNPYTDIAKTAQGTWRWASDKPLLHAHIRDYFWDRKEDGEVLSQA